MYGIVALIIGLVLGIAIVLLIFRNSHASGDQTTLVSRSAVLQSQVENLNKQLESAKNDSAAKVDEISQKYELQLKVQREDAEKQKEDIRRQYEGQIESLKSDRDMQMAALKEQYNLSLNTIKTDAEKQKAEMQEHYRQQLTELNNQQKAQLEQQSALIREQINTASETILKKRSDELSSTNKEQLAAILNPLHENLKQMRDAVEKNDKDQSERLVQLNATIKENLKQAQEVGERADKLAQALTSENKTQGNFGELRLRTLLENMGLQEGVQFEEQVTLRDEKGNTIKEEENGRRMIPDVILHFPDNRDVVIDSKMSLKAFQDYYNAETDEQKADALNRHIASVRFHVKELKQKNYSNYVGNGHQKLDFVLMYIYSESALQLALANDPELWKEAYDQGVVISGSQNLYMTLRVLEMTWRQVSQADNQENIMKTANELINKVQVFYERFITVEEQMNKTQKSFESLKTVTAPTGKSIITTANKLLKYGAQESPKRKYKLPKSTEDEDDGELLLEEKEE